MVDADLLARLTAPAAPRGRLVRALSVGPWRLRVEGLDPDLAAALDRRWGGFVAPAVDGSEDLAVVVTDAGPQPWRTAGAPGEAYRVEALRLDRGPALLSYRFAAIREGADSWRVGLSAGEGEPDGRAVENAVRMLSARLAIERGGFAVHGAGVVRAGRGHVFAGPSRAGKSTAVRLAAPCVPLGDDFAVLFPGDRGWRTAAVPFDNAERAPASPPRGSVPLAGLWRLHHGPPDVPARVVLPPRPSRVAVVLSCVAAPWTVPDLEDALLDTTAKFAAESTVGELYFRLAPDLWDALPR